MRRPIIAGNWKMFKTVPQALELVIGLKRELYQIEDKEIVVCPPFTALNEASEALNSSNIKLGAQDLFWLESGAYTGEISPLMLAELCEFVIIGHSERRQYFNETDEIINKKIKAALKVGLKPILCIGERLEENEAGLATKVVTKQLRSALVGIDDLSKMIIAYEPIWAIGTGRAATGEQANQTISLIRHNVSRLYDKKTAQDVRILYGGSVTAENATEFMQQPEIDGALVGGASLKADQFLSIVKQTSQIRQVG